MDLELWRKLDQAATPGPWRGCNHVRKPAFDAECKCRQATVWSETADTIVLDKYRNEDGSGPEPVMREEELANMAFCAEARTALPEAVAWIERAIPLLVVVAATSEKSIQRAEARTLLDNLTPPPPREEIDPPLVVRQQQNGA